MTTNIKKECLEQLLLAIKNKGDELYKKAQFYNDRDYILNANDCISIITEELNKLTDCEEKDDEEV